MAYNLAAIAAQFKLDGSLVEAEPFGSGHINDTYCLSCSGDGGKKRYVLQRINHHVFKHPPTMTDNVPSAAATLPPDTGASR